MVIEIVRIVSVAARQFPPGTLRHWRRRGTAVIEHYGLDEPHAAGEREDGREDGRFCTVILRFINFDRIDRRRGTRFSKRQSYINRKNCPRGKTGDGDQAGEAGEGLENGL